MINNNMKSDKPERFQIDLTKERYSGVLKVSRDFIDNVDINVLEDHISTDIIIQFNKEFAGRRDATTHTITIPTPKNDLERIRERYNLLTKWFPIKYRILSKVVTFEELIVFPKVDPRKFASNFKINTIL